MSIIVAILFLGAIVHAQPAVRIPPPDMFSCEGLSVGQHPVAPNACESYFYQCTDGLSTGIRLNCADGTWYDAISKQCLFARDVEACGGVATTTTPYVTTTISADFTRAPFAISCADLVDGDYPNPNVPCSAVYATCASGTAYYRRCPSDTRFDHISRECLAREFVKTCFGDVTTRAPSTTTMEQLDEGIRFDCTSLPDGLYSSTVNVCSEKFWSCTAGASRLFTCPSGLKFDVDSQSCLEGQFIVACGGTATTTIVTTTHAESVDEEDLKKSCAGLDVGTYADPRMKYKTEWGSCSNWFIVCTGIPRAIVHRCPSDLVYDISSSKCNYRDETYACTGVMTTTAETTTTTQSNDFEPAPQGFCDGKLPGNYDLEEKKCSHKYVTCTSGRGWIVKCPSGTYFDAEFNRCDYHDSIPLCSGRERPTTTVAPMFPQDETPGLHDFCTTKKPGNYPLHSVCTTSFVTCSNGRASVTHCPGNTRYSSEVDACLSPQDIPACVHYDSGSNLCAGRFTGFYAVPDDCSKFVFCSRGMPVIQSCVDGLIWDSQRARCMPMSEVSGKCGLATPLNDFSCEGKTPGYYTRAEESCAVYYFCEKDGSAWAFACTPGYAFDISSQECLPAGEVKQCLPPRDDTLKPFCETHKDGVFTHPLKCDKGVICWQTFAYPIACSQELKQFDRYTMKCTATLSVEAQCKPIDSVVTGAPI